MDAAEILGDRGGLRVGFREKEELVIEEICDVIGGGCNV